MLPASNKPQHTQHQQPQHQPDKHVRGLPDCLGYEKGYEHGQERSRVVDQCYGLVRRRQVQLRDVQVQTWQQ